MGNGHCGRVEHDRAERRICVRRSLPVHAKPAVCGRHRLLRGVSVLANSVLLWITHLLLCLWFVIEPLAEEPWLEEQYGDAYREYRRRVPRFL